MLTQYFLIQLQLIDLFFFCNCLTNEEGVSDKKNVTMHSSIMIFAYFIYFKSLPSPLLAALRRTFL